MIDSVKIDRIADGVAKLSSHFDAMMVKQDDWSPEARKAAAEARKGGTKSGGEDGKEKMHRAIEVHNEMLNKYNAGKISKQEMTHHHNVFRSAQASYEKGK